MALVDAVVQGNAASRLALAGFVLSRTLSLVYTSLP